MRLGALFLPRFPLQRLVLEQPSLSGQPIVLHSDNHGSQRVQFVSASALKLGLRPGMTVSAAAAVAPAVVKRQFDPAAEAKALCSLGERLMAASPAFQIDSPEGLWLDASASHLAGGEVLWAKVLVSSLSEAGYRARCVVASERFTAQAMAKFGGQPITVVGPRDAASLAPLPLQALEVGWLGLGATAPFRALGLTTLGELAGLASGALVARFGAMGLHAARLCRADDDSRFIAHALPEQVHESVQLDWPAEHLEPLLFALKTIVDRVCGRLQGRQQAAVQLTVTLTLESRQRQPVPLRLARPTSQAKLLLELIRHRLTDLTVNQPITALEVLIDEACAEPGRQLMLGDAPAGEAELEVVLSRLQSALGPDTLFSAVPQAQHRPEDGWVATPFRPPDAGRLSEVWGVVEADWALGTEQEEVAREQAVIAPACLEPLPEKPVRPAPMWLPGQAQRSDEEGQVVDLVAFIEQQAGQPHIKPKAKIVETPKTAATTMLARPPRLFREPSALHVDVADDGAMRWVTLLGKRRRVESLCGPERLTGAWWAPQPFARDYYRVQIEGVGALWVFRDGRDGGFYVQGMFD